MGLLIGAERELRAHESRFAGVRTFPIASLTGAFGALAGPWFVAVLASPIGSFAVVDHFSATKEAPNREFALEGAKRAEIVPTRGNLTTDHGEALVDAAIGGVAVFQAHDYGVERPVAQGKLIEMLGAFACLGPPMILLFAQGRRPPKVRVFTDFLVDLLAP